MMCLSRMMCFCRPLSWAAAMALVLTGLLAAGCDGGPTWNETDPAVGPEDPNVVTGTIGSEGGLVYGPDSSVVAAGEDVFPSETELSIQRVPAEEVETGYLPSEVPVVGKNVYEIKVDREALVKQSVPSPIVAVPVPEELSPSELSIAVKPPVRIGQPEGEKRSSPPWELQVSEPVESERQLAIDTRGFFQDGVRFAVVRANPIDIVDNEGSPSAATSISKADQQGFNVYCWPGTFNLGQPCTEASVLTEIAETLEEDVLPSALEDIREAGYEEAYLDECQPALKLDWPNDEGEECSADIGGSSYEINLVGKKDINDKGDYSVNRANIDIRAEKNQGGGWVTRSPDAIYRTGRHELLHAFQFGHVGSDVFAYSSSYFGALNRFGNAKHDWVKEGMAALAARSLGSSNIRPNYKERFPLSVYQDQLNDPNIDYNVQDFWGFVTRRQGVRQQGPYGLGFSFTRKVLDKVAQADIPIQSWVQPVSRAFQEEGIDLSDAYWRWVRDQAYEGQVIGRDGEDACDYLPSNDGPIEGDVQPNSLKRIDAGSRSPMSSRTFELTPQWPANQRNAFTLRIATPSGNTSGLRAKAYIEGNSNCTNNGRTGLMQEFLDISGDETIYVLVSNTLVPGSSSGTSSASSVSPTRKSRAYDITLTVVPKVPRPTDLKAQSRDSSASLTWQPPETPPSSFTGEYNVYRSTSEFEDPSEATLAGEEIPEDSFTDTGLENGQTYYYRVTAVYEAEDGTNLPFESDPTSQVEVKPLPEPPDRP